jgi:hypothetical protein
MEAITMLDREFKYYIDHQDELVRKYNGKYLIVVGDKVEGAFDERIDAILDGRKRFGAGNFMVQLCSPGDESYTLHVHANISFA